MINPVGRLLMDFKDVDEKAFNTIAEDWFDILGNLLDKGCQEKFLTIKFPQQYVDWLTQNENPYYEKVGLELQKNKGLLKLSSDDIVDDIVASLSYKISYTLQDIKDDIAFVVFSNPIIRNSSFVVKKVKLDGIEFLRYESWKDSYNKKKKQGVEGEKVFSVNGVSFTMIRIEGGTFMMGATTEQKSEAYGSEKPKHQVTLSSFYIGKYEVTQELWQAVMGNNPSYFKGANKPVEQVSWDDCQEFICKLNNLTNAHFRLLTEAEWEYAARSGKQNQGYKYAGSNILSSVAWYNDNSSSETHPVGQKQPNELGLYDMSGNVCEWCQDWFGNYSSSSQTNPTGPNSGSNRVNRGGSWSLIAGLCRSSHRNNCTPSYRNSDLGFRLAL
jgi:formylglycine-generating enzyme required for sulfatase activity